MTTLSQEEAERLLERVVKRCTDIDTIVHIDDYHGEITVDVDGRDAEGRDRMRSAVSALRPAVVTLVSVGLLRGDRRYWAVSGDLLTEPPAAVPTLNG